MRLDTLLADTEKISREKAKELIQAGHVTVNGRIIKKPGTRCEQGIQIGLDQPKTGYVSRGGHKLEAALSYFGINVENADCIDIGASTGGFTDCLLQHGAALVYAIDVGTGQMHPTLVNHPKVISIEQINIKDFNADISSDIIVIDVSFISLKTVLPIAYNLLNPDGCCIALVKPQFEVGPSNLNKKGLVRDMVLHQKVIGDIGNAAKAIGFSLIGHTRSQLQGKKSGNTEYFYYLKK